MRAWLLLFSAILLSFAFSFADAAQSVSYNTDSQDVIEARLKKYAGGDEQREQTLKQMFAQSGCDSQHLTEQAVKGSKLPNVICVLPGKSEKVIIVGAHYDHVSAGDGVVDNWSGASLLPSLYDAVKSDPRTHTFIFIGFAAEEKGMIGSRFYVRQMTKEQIAATDAMVNMDTLGLAPTEIWVSHSDKKLTNALATVANKLNLPVKGVDVEQVGSSDAEQFSARNIPRITVHSLTQETWNARILHTSKDKLSAIRVDDYYQTYRLLAAYIAYLDQFLSTSAPERSH